MRVWFEKPDPRRPGKGCGVWSDYSITARTTIDAHPQLLNFQKICRGAKRPRPLGEAALPPGVQGMVLRCDPSLARADMTPPANGPAFTTQAPNENSPRNGQSYDAAA